MEYTFTYKKVAPSRYQVYVMEEDKETRIGTVHKDADRKNWLASPTDTPLVSPFADTPQRKFPSRQAASMWLLGIADGKSDWLNALRAKYALNH